MFDIFRRFRSEQKAVYAVRGGIASGGDVENVTATDDGDAASGGTDGGNVTARGNVDRAVARWIDAGGSVTDSHADVGIVARRGITNSSAGNRRRRS